ncbi:SEL1-like repeat protein [Pseudoduganella lutea]|uniref:Sel1 repeat family protein n=1 Tax=Pseudoduganella lutea TaxID=321985 RepID=A0A4P6L3S5_9BURK|nr:DUF6396 domain-containing protein [Pseudoduganella lutea]QBE65498.1 sel1 repeat family protein [Pseudoduganella lutea]
MLFRHHLVRKLIAILVALFTLLFGYQMNSLSNNALPRDEKLPLFDPHMPAFACTHEAAHIPPIDAEAEAWFLEARALEDPEIYVDDRDYKKIVELTRQAAERRHWKAMLNLASLYLEGRDPARGTADALRLVEEAMRLGIPAAYDRMGTYYSNGTGVPGDATTAHAFWLRAAQLGNPQSMVFLANKMNAVWDSPKDGFWANMSIATKMFECALAQGFGDAAYPLHFRYLHPQGSHAEIIAADPRETRLRALQTLHLGVKLGCSMCANHLYIDFDHPFDLSEMIVPFVDKARGERYRVLADYLDFNPHIRYPNLDQVLPLPPANLPTWNGDTNTLIEAAKGTCLSPLPGKTVTPSQKAACKNLDPVFHLRRSGENTQEKTAPFAGYWQAQAPDAPVAIQETVAAMSPALYARGERFNVPHVYEPTGKPVSSWLVWEHWLTVDADESDVRPRAARGLARDVEHPVLLRSSGSDLPCPVTGIWQPWIDPGHPMQQIVNVYWRQAWIREGQSFPHPQRDWLLDLPEELLTWHLLDKGIDIDADRGA